MADPAAPPEPPVNPTTVLLVRHAVTEQTGKVLYGRAPGIDLSETGRAQADALATRLAGLPIAAIYASPIERAQQTAQPLSVALGMIVRTHEGLVEVDTGEFTGKTFEELGALDDWKRIVRQSSRAQLPGGESLAQMQVRAVDAVEQIVRLHSGETVVAVSHRDPILAVIAHYSGAHLDHYERIAAAPASVSVLQFGSHGALVLKCNDTGSLADLVPEPPEQSHESEASNG
ncbi:MAG: histidine phosphatase family protein [Acidimicrobiia bacterium]